jgi:hypothetical protein
MRSIFAAAGLAFLASGAFGSAPAQAMAAVPATAAALERAVEAVNILENANGRTARKARSRRYVSEWQYGHWLPPYFYRPDGYVGPFYYYAGPYDYGPYKLFRPRYHSRSTVYWR